MTALRRWLLPTLVAALLGAGCATPEPGAPPAAPATKAQETDDREKDKPVAVPPPAAKPAVPAPVPVKPKPAPPPPEPPPASAPEPARALGGDELAKGVRSYEDGDYVAAAKQFQAALDLGLAEPRERAIAHKHLAFIACVSQRTSVCRSEFRKALAADPTFDLTRAEAGHPVWGPVFRSVKPPAAKPRPKPRPG